MTEKIAKWDGFSSVLTDGVKRAAEKIGKSSEKYAMHVRGQEIPAHDTRGDHGFAIAYAAEPTPERHT